MKNKHKYEWIVTIKDIDCPKYIDKLKRYLNKISDKIQSGESLKIILNSNGGNSEFMKDVLEIVISIFKKGCFIDLYCLKVQSAALLLLTLLKGREISRKIYAYPKATFMWHKPTFFVEFEGKLANGNQFLFEGDIESLLPQSKRIYEALLQENEEYKKTENIYIDIIQKSILSHIKREIDEEIPFNSYMAQYRSLVDEVIES